MTQSIFEKVRNAVLSNVHRLLDAVIDMDSIGSIKQHVRDLEEARDSVADEAAVANGRANALVRTVASLEAKRAATDENIDLLLTDNDESNDHHAMPLAEQSLRIAEDVVLKQEELAAQQALAASLTDARRKLTAKHAEMLRGLHRLESMERAAKAREKATSALRGAAAVTNSANNVSVDDVAQRVRDRDAVSQARFDQALSDIGNGDSADAVRASQAAAFIAARRAELSGEATTE